MAKFNLSPLISGVEKEVAPAVERAIAEHITPAVERATKGVTGEAEPAIIRQFDEFMSSNNKKGAALPGAPSPAPAAPPEMAAPVPPTVNLKTSTNTEIEGDALFGRHEGDIDRMFRPDPKSPEKNKLFTEWGYVTGKYEDPISGEVKDLPDTITMSRGKSDRLPGTFGGTVDKSPLYNQWFFRNGAAFRGASLPEARARELDAMKELDGMTLVQAVQWAKDNVDKLGTQGQLYTHLLTNLDNRLRYLEYVSGSTGKINIKGIKTGDDSAAFFWQHPERGIGHGIWLDEERATFPTLVHELIHAAHHSLLNRTTGDLSHAIGNVPLSGSSYPETHRTLADMPPELSGSLRDTEQSYKYFLNYTNKLCKKLGYKNLAELSEKSSRAGIELAFTSGKITATERNVAQLLGHSNAVNGPYHASDIDEFTTATYMDHNFANVLGMIPAKGPKGATTAKELFGDAMQKLIGKDTSGNYPSKSLLFQVLSQLERVTEAASGAKSTFAESVESALMHRREHLFEMSNTKMIYRPKTAQEIATNQHFPDFVSPNGEVFRGQVGAHKFEQIPEGKAKTTSRAEFQAYLHHAVAGQWYYDGIKPSTESVMERMNMLIGRRSPTAPLADEFAAKTALKEAEKVLKSVFSENPVWNSMHGLTTMSPETRAAYLPDWFNDKFGADGKYVRQLFSLAAREPELVSRPGKFNKAVAELYSNWKLGNLGSEKFTPPRGLEQLYLNAENLLAGRTPAPEQAAYFTRLDVSPLSTEPPLKAPSPRTVPSRVSDDASAFIRSVGGGQSKGLVTVEGERVYMMPSKSGQEVTIGRQSDTQAPAAIRKITDAADANNVSLVTEVRTSRSWTPPGEAPAAVKIDTEGFIPKVNSAQVDGEGKTTHAIDDTRSGERTGATFNNDGSLYTGGGLIVPVRSVNIPSSELTAERVAAFLKSKEDFISNNMYRVGIYKFENQDLCSIDLNIIVPDEQQELALRAGKWLGQKSLFSLTTFEEIPTGADGSNPVKLNAEQTRYLGDAFQRDVLPSYMESTSIADQYMANAFSIVKIVNKGEHSIVTMRRPPQVEE